MGYKETSRFCSNCNKQVLARKKGTNHILHLLLTLLTGGLWLIIWILCAIVNGLGSWRCSFCGQKIWL